MNWYAIMMMSFMLIASVSCAQIQESSQQRKISSEKPEEGKKEKKHREFPAGQLY